MKEKIILDCDPGHDDAIAILLAAMDERTDLLGITTVAGNSYVENTTLNALKIAELAKIEVGVYRGADLPLVRDQIIAPGIHGDSGLEGTELPEPKMNEADQHAVDYMVETVESNPGEINLVATGPLTNIAIFARKHPKTFEKIKRLVMMGGGIGFGNTTPVAEFNIHADPEAAAIVFGTDVEKILAPLDLTHQAVMSEEYIRKLKTFRKKGLDILADLMGYFHSTYKKVFGIDGAVLHDPCTVMYLIDPTIFESETLHVDVELRGEFTYGQTVADIWKTTGKAPNMRVLKKMDRKKFFDILFEDLEKIE